MMTEYLFQKVFMSTIRSGTVLNIKNNRFSNFQFAMIGPMLLSLAVVVVLAVSGEPDKGYYSLPDSVDISDLLNEDVPGMTLDAVVPTSPYPVAEGKPEVKIYDYPESKYGKLLELVRKLTSLTREWEHVEPLAVTFATLNVAGMHHYGPAAGARRDTDSQINVTFTAKPKNKTQEKVSRVQLNVKHSPNKKNQYYFLKLG